MIAPVGKKSYLSQEARELKTLGKNRIEIIKNYDLLDLLLTPRAIETLSDKDLKILHELAAKNPFIAGDIDGRFGMVALTKKIEGDLTEMTTPAIFTRDEMLADLDGIFKS